MHRASIAQALQMGCIPEVEAEKIVFSDFTITNDENTKVMVRYIKIYIDEVETEAIYCGDYLLEKGQTARFAGTTIYAAAGWHTYHIEIYGFRWDSFWGIWWPETWKWPSHQIEVPQKYNPMPDLLKGILTISVILILFYAIYRFVFLHPPHKNKEAWQD